MLNSVQQQRVQAYRRRRGGGDSEDSGARPWDIAGNARAVEPLPSSQPPSHAPSLPRAAPSTPGNTHGVVTPGRPSAAGHGANGHGDDGGAPQDITSYILQLEQQNRDLRLQLTDAQSRLAHAEQGVSIATAERTEESKRAFLNDVLSQVESIVEAHRNKAAAEIQHHKAEAEQAQLALKQLREAIHTEGMDLALAPALIAFHRKQAKAAATGEGRNPAALNITLPDETEQMLDQVATDMLAKLLAVQDPNDLGPVVRTGVKSGFETLVVHFTDQVIGALKEQQALVDSLKADLDEEERKARTAELTHEAQRVRMATEHSLEMDALRDEIRVLNAASGNDNLTTAVHEKAFAEYAQLLVEARREAANLRQELDNEKNHSAQVCLKLKGALQKRSTDFESAVVSRAEEVVQQRDRLIADLEARLREREAAHVVRERKDFGLQAGEPLVNLPEKERFVPQLLASMRSDARATAQSNEMFERDVWRKTHELLNKYGGKARAADRDL